jgi:hypothetical protein
VSWFLERFERGRDAAEAEEVRERLGDGVDLPSPIRAQAERAFGRSLEDVRVHSDAAAAASLGARAFAVGRDIAFAPGEFRPGTLAGDALIAHEVAHVLQQEPAGGVAAGALAAEADATRAAAAVVLGGRASVDGGYGVAVRRCTPDQAAPTDFSTLPRWIRDAGVELRLDTPEGRRADIFALNRRITAAYARMYLRDPSTFRWAGMAAYASAMVGEGLRQAQLVREGVGGPVFAAGEIATGAPTGTQMMSALGAGNIGVYRDIYWQHLAYSRGGIAELERVFRTQEIRFPQRALDAWRLIDRGHALVAQGNARQGNDLVWQGNEALLRFEQEETLQHGVYDLHREAFRWSSSWPNMLPLRSPVPGDTADFGTIVPGGDLGEFTQRWRWIHDSMLPTYRHLVEQNPQRVRHDMEELAARGG